MAIVDGYLDLVTSEHRLKPKYISMLKILLSYTDEPMELCFRMPSIFDIDEAEGVQLDVIGEYLGKSRRLLYNSEQGESSILSDSLYRILLKATILRMNWNGGIEDLVRDWERLIDGINISIRDNQDMTMDVTVIGSVDKMLVELIEKGYIVPKPQGVRVNYQVSQNPVFAYDMENDNFAGYEHGEWK